VEDSEFGVDSAPKVQELMKIAKALDTSIDYLLTGGIMFTTVPITLTGLKVLPEYNRSTFSELPKKLQIKIKNTSIQLISFPGKITA
jgi:hypothetical protein